MCLHEVHVQTLHITVFNPRLNIAGKVFASWTSMITSSGLTIILMGISMLIYIQQIYILEYTLIYNMKYAAIYPNIHVGVHANIQRGINSNIHQYECRNIQKEALEHTHIYASQF